MPELHSRSHTCLYKYIVNQTTDMLLIRLFVMMFKTEFSFLVSSILTIHAFSANMRLVTRGTSSYYLLF